MKPGSDIKESAALLQDYATKEYEYAHLKLFYHTATLSTIVVKSTLFGVFALVGLAFFSIAMALWIGSLLNSWMLGFLIMGGVFFLGALIIYLMRKRIERYVVQHMSLKYFEL